MDRQPQRALSTMVYVACARTDEIMVFAADPSDGGLATVQRITAGTGITPLTVRPDRQFLYAGLRGQMPAARCFAIDPTTGELRAGGSAALSDPPMYVSTDASGRFLLSASYAGDAFAINPIGSDGTVESAPIQRTPTPPRAHGIRVDRSNRFLFVTALGGDAILQYLFDAQTGRATPNAVPFVATAPGSGPRHLVFHPTADVLYVNGELDGSVSSYVLDAATGRLAPLSRMRMLPDAETREPWAAELAITPDGNFLYASERRTSILATFDLRGEPGTLVRANMISTEEQPRSFAIDPSGRWLVLAGEKSNHLCVYAVDPSTGALAAQHRYPVGEKPAWVTIAALYGALESPKPGA